MVFLSQESALAGATVRPARMAAEQSAAHPNERPLEIYLVMKTVPLFLRSGVPSWGTRKVRHPECIRLSIHVSRLAAVARGKKVGPGRGSFYGTTELSVAGT